MKTVIKLLNKKYDKPLYKHKAYRKTYRTMLELLKEYEVLCDAKLDVDCFRYEIMVSSLKTKQQFEDVFFDTYVSMHDYWYDLTYQERKRQMNLEISKLIQTLPYFMEEDQKIYMPCFDKAFNHLYTDEIVLLDLKQYHVFIRSCAKEMKDQLYRGEAYRHSFSSCEVVAENEDGYVLYHPLMNRFYVYQADVFQYCLSFSPKQKERDINALQTMGKVLLEKDDLLLLDTLLDGTMVNDRLKKKLHKIKGKVLKKKLKKKDKE